MPLPLNQFAAAAAQAVGNALGVDPSILVVGAPPRPDMGDYAVGCFPAAKQLKKAPPVLAKQAADAFEPGDALESAQAAGPFVNFRANQRAVYRWLLEATVGGGGLIPQTPGRGKTICIDYSSPNISKHLAYHHIRSTVIGHALVNLYRAVGYRVVGINHLGDWGTTHGMLLAAYDKWGASEPLTVDQLNDLYVKFRAKMADDPELEEQGRAWFKRLEDGDEEARSLWTRFRDVSLAEYQSVYDVLGIEFEEVKGESEYLDDMPGVIDMLDAKGLTEFSEGALVVPLGDDTPPLLLKKRDGATLYPTRDLAAALYRWNTYHFERSLYVVDRGQSLHFLQLFSTLKKAGMEWADRCVHVPFGLVRIGGKKTGTRKGNVVLLKEVLAEAQARSRERILEKNSDMPEDVLDATARMVGVGAIVFANLASQREKDVDFEWEDVLSTDGDSGPYIQYAHARSCSALGKAEGVEPAVDADVSLLQNDEEWRLARQLTDMPDVVFRAADSNDPHILSRYLLDVCSSYSHWWQAGKNDASKRFLVDDPALSAARLSLVAATRDALRTGLAILGIEAPSAM